MKSELKVSIITVCYNNITTIAQTIKSIISQTYNNIEYIIIDGGSTDGTLKIIDQYRNNIHRLISEADNGTYDAMNKGIKIATGDIIGTLNSDDFFCNDKIVEEIVKNFNEEIDLLYGDVQFVKFNDFNKVIRYYSSKNFTVKKFKFGFMPAHPSVYIRKHVFEKVGLYKLDYKIASDYELLLRILLIHNVKSKYINMPFVSMRTGGISNKSIRSRIILNNEILRACNENGIKSNFIVIYLKYFIKMFEFLPLKSSDV